ncbi:MAG: hypothetical protein BWY45_02286 [Euryarchaeota archaeon ADurb.Bin294]|jgi:hypothetical protein|nr:MAG: hypothetical protein BWY45_02286 [Euryarchaeota archaeon ADurb.Bin294]
MVIMIYKKGINNPAVGLSVHSYKILSHINSDSYEFR